MAESGYLPGCRIKTESVLVVLISNQQHCEDLKELVLLNCDQMKNDYT